MESNYSNRDFEQFIKQNADQYRMFPSEKAWKNIHNTLHTRKRWYGAGLAFLLLLTAGSVTWVMLTNPVSDKQQGDATDRAAGNTPSARSSTATSAASISDKENHTSVNDLIAFRNETVNGNQPLHTADPVSIFPGNNNPGIIIDNSKSTSEAASGTVLLPESQDVRTELTTPAIITRKIDEPGVVVLLQPAIDEPDPAGGTGINELPKEAAATDKPVVIMEALTEDSYPLSIESVVNTYRNGSFGKKLAWQVFVTPTISYRQLSANENINAATGYPYPGLGDVNNAVTHRPDLGVQLGVAAGYPLSEKLKLRGGVQFNVNRYDIKAFAYNPEIATIELNDANGSSISAWTSYRNYGGYKTDWLKNFYFSVSVPVGAELTLLGNDKTSWGIAGTIQPTYILKDKAYLISTDYKNYAKVPWLVRRLNLSASFETFITLGTNTKWQIGPQVRYQVLSSFHNKYPVKEHLFDFGLKIGVFINND